MPTLSDLVFGLLVPGALAAVVLLAVARAGLRLPGAARDALGALAIGLGYAVAQAAILGAPGSPLAPDALPLRDRLFWLVALAVVLAPLRAAGTAARWTRPFATALLAVALVRFLRVQPPAGPAGLASAFGAVVLVWALWTGWERVAAARAGWAVPAALLAAASCLALTALANRSGVLAQLTGAICAALGAALVVALRVPAARLPAGAITAAAVALGGVARICAIYDLPPASIALCAAAFGLPCLVELTAWKRTLGPGRAGALGVLLALAPGLVAAWTAWSARGSAW